MDIDDFQLIFRSILYISDLTGFSSIYQIIGDVGQNGRRRVPPAGGAAVIHARRPQRTESTKRLGRITAIHALAWGKRERERGGREGEGEV